MKFCTRSISHAGTLGFVFLIAASILAIAVETHTKTLDGASTPDVVVVVAQNSIRPADPADIPTSLNDSLSDVVELFLRKAIVAYEEKVHPTKYSALSYILPNDQLGIIEKNGQAKSVKPEDVPKPVRQALGEATTQPH